MLRGRRSSFVCQQRPTSPLLFRLFRFESAWRRYRICSVAVARLSCVINDRRRLFCFVCFVSRAPGGAMLAARPSLVGQCFVPAVSGLATASFISFLLKSAWQRYRKVLRASGGGSFKLRRSVGCSAFRCSIRRTIRSFFKRSLPLSESFSSSSSSFRCEFLPVSLPCVIWAITSRFLMSNSGGKW